MDSSSANKDEPNLRPLNVVWITLGFLVFIFGVAVVSWTGLQAYSALRHPKQIVFTEKFFSGPDEARHIVVDGRQVVLPQMLFELFVFGVCP